MQQMELQELQNNLYKFSYDYNQEFLLSEATDLDGYFPFVDPLTKNTINDWLIKHVKKDNSYGWKICEHFTKITGMKCKPRFYDQKKGFTLPFHKDRGTKCSINIVLSDDPDPILFRDQKVLYKIGLLNTEAEHSVIATKQRLLYKLSFFDNSFLEVREVRSNAGF
jgi:hypothetical protein